MMAKAEVAPAAPVEAAPDDELRTVRLRQAAETLGCRRSKIYSLARQGRLELVRFDGRTHVTVASLTRLRREIAAQPIQLGKARP